VKETRADPKRKNPASTTPRACWWRSCATRPEFDALIVPTLYVQRAALSGGRARWDGAEHALELETREGAVALPDGAPSRARFPPPRYTRWCSLPTAPSCTRAAPGSRC
jgi:hypothetical protein